MHSRRRSLAIPLAALSLALLPAAMLARCGIWPDFPARDSGIDAGDVVTDGGDAHGSDAADVPTDIRHDAAPDAPPFGGFMQCTAPTADAGVFQIMNFAGLPGGERDLTFNGSGRLITVGNNVETFDAMGTESNLMVTPTFANGLSVRMTASGLIAATVGGVGVTGALDLIDPSTNMVQQVTMTTDASMLIFPASLAVLPSGVIFVSDTFADAVIRVATDGTQVTFFSMMNLHPTGLALTPDARHLYVASPALSNVYQIDLDANGMMMGSPTVYVNEVLNGSGMAFDACGYLYISDRDRGRMLRVQPRGTMVESLALGPFPAEGGTFAPSGIAFGRGTGFDPMSLYVVDVGHNAIVKIPVGVMGAQIVGP